MNTDTQSSGKLDPYNLNRFLSAQADNYDDALRELQGGRKRSHWMWYVFPQIDGLAFSSTSKFYAIKSVDEARAYLNHPVLGSRLQECAAALLRIEGRSAREILGSPDDLKLCSSATLFASVAIEDSVFHQLLDKYFQGQRDDKTLQRLRVAGAEVQSPGGEGTHLERRD